MRKDISKTARAVVVMATAAAVGANVPCALAGEASAAPGVDEPSAAAEFDSVQTAEPTYDAVGGAEGQGPAEGKGSLDGQVPEPDQGDAPSDSAAPAGSAAEPGEVPPAGSDEAAGPANGQQGQPEGTAEPEASASDQVAPLSLGAGASLSATSVDAGTAVTVTPAVTGASGDVKFNYVWERDGWRSWGSDVKGGAATTATSKTYTFLVPGTYHLYVDVISQGQTVTVDAGSVVVRDTAWDVKAQLSTTQSCPGNEVSLGVQTPGVAGDVRFNYVWQRDGWQDWGSNIHDGGSYTSERQWSFAPTQPGSYTLYVDVVDSSGSVVRTVAAGQLTVAADAWGASVALSSEQIAKGGTVTVTPAVAGTDTAGFTYNYVWNYEGAWAEWGSTVKDTGSTTAQASWDFTPTKAGRYDLYVDVKSASGVSRTVAASVFVDPGYTFGGVSCSKAYAKPGQTVTVLPEMGGQTEGVTYIYVWNYEGAWAEWGSTVKDTGSSTLQASWDFTPTKAGTYTLYVDAIGPDGYTTTKETQLVVWEAKGLVAAPSSGNSSWTVSCDLGSAPLDGFTFNYVWKKGSDEGDWSQWGSTVNETGGRTSQSSHTFTFSERDYYWLYVDVVDPEGNSSTVSTKVGYFSTGKAGYQNPSSMYQVSSFNVAPNPNAYGVFSYMTPSRISQDATRSDCVEAFIGRAYDYLGTSYVWNYACAPGVGVDCIGLVFQCAYAVGMDLGEFNPYDHYATGANGWHSRDANNMWNYGKIMRLSVDQRQRGDLIFYSGHVAIYLGNDTVIEALPPSVRISNMWNYGTPIGVGRLFA